MVMMGVMMEVAPPPLVVMVRADLCEAWPLPPAANQVCRPFARCAQELLALGGFEQGTLPPQGPVHIPLGAAAVQGERRA